MAGDHGDAGRRFGRIAQFLLGLERQPQHVFLPAAKQGQHAMRWDVGDLLAEVEPVAELRAGLLPALDHGRDEQGVVVQMGTQFF